MIGVTCFFTSNDKFVLNMDFLFGTGLCFVELGYDANIVYTLPLQKL